MKHFLVCRGCGLKLRATPKGCAVAIEHDINTECARDKAHDCEMQGWEIEPA